jgi:hypothetical protein
MIINKINRLILKIKLWKIRTIKIVILIIILINN